MSDLCYNCGDCHLPRPCPISLKHCDICNNYGHCYSFCPTSVRLKQPDYQFWALCHNCDAWHLPEGCKYPLRQCKQCGHYGHLEYFCPVNPLSRQATRALNEEQDGNKSGIKRQRVGGSDASEAVHSTAASDPTRAENIRLIKTETACHVLRLRNQGFADSEILRQITVAPLDSHTNNSAAPMSAGSDQSTFKSAFDPRSAQAASPNNNFQPPMTPTTSVYTSQHERFSSGDLAQNMSTQYTNSYVGESTPVVPNNTPATTTTKPATRKNSAKGATCAECKGSKKRCPHQDAAAAPAAQPAPQLAPPPKQLAPPPGYVEASSFVREPPPSTESWSGGYTNFAPVPMYAATMPDSIDSRIASAMDHDKGSLGHVLNGNSTPMKPFLYSHLGGNYNTPADNLPAVTLPGLQNSVPVTSEQLEIAKPEQMFVDSHQDIQNTGTEAFVKVPNMTEPAQIQTQEQIQAPQPQEELQPEQQAQTDPASEATQEEAKPKKGRGRPRRKN